MFYKISLICRFTQFIHSKTNLICSPIEKLIKHNALFSWLFLSLKKKKKKKQQHRKKPSSSRCLLWKGIIKCKCSCLRRGDFYKRGHE